MRNSTNRVTIGGVTVALTAVMAAAPAGATGRTVELQPLADTTDTVVLLLADDGTVVGTASMDGYQHAIRWDRHGEARDLGPLPGHTQSRPTAMNSRGDPVGFSNAHALIGDNAVRWDRRGRTVALAPEYATSTAVDVNDAGTVTGQVGEKHAVRWSASGAITYLPAPADAPVGKAVAINARGTVTGQVHSPFIGGPEYAVRWDRRGGVELLAAYPGAQVLWPGGIDDHDRVVGMVATATSGRVVRWDRTGHVAALPLPPGGTSSLLTYVSADGVVLGTVSTAAGQVAVRWDGTRPTVLAVPGSTAVLPAAVNSRGTVVGTAVWPDGSTTAVRWDRHGLTRLPGTSAVAINDRGDILGYAATGPVVWHQGH